MRGSGADEDDTGSFPSFFSSPFSILFIPLSLCQPLPPSSLRLHGFPLSFSPPGSLLLFSPLVLSLSIPSSLPHPPPPYKPLHM